MKMKKKKKIDFFFHLELTPSLPYFFFPSTQISEIFVNWITPNQLDQYLQFNVLDDCSCELFYFRDGTNERTKACNFLPPSFFLLMKKKNIFPSGYYHCYLLDHEHELMFDM